MPAMDKGKVLISGASGLIGGAVSSFLTAQGYTVSRLVRGQISQAGDVAWDPLQPIDPGKVSGFHAVIHLAGENIFGVWTREKKQRIQRSRKTGTSNLAEGLAQAQQKPQVFICASATGFYGDRGDEILDEESSSGAGFLAEVCREWEAATASATNAGIRTANIRIGIVLSPTGGALKIMFPPFRMGFGGKLGSGKQWWSWIHIHDLTGALEHILLHDSLHGPINLVTSNPARNAEFTAALAKALSRPAFFPVPEFMLRLVLGRSANELLLASQRVMPKKLNASDYSFRFPELQPAFESLV